MGRMVAVTLGLLGALFSGAYAQPYPSRPIRVVVPFAAGGTATINSRIVGNQLEEQLGQPIVIDNRPGANGIIGIQIVSNATPDGYTLLYTTTSIAINPSVYRKLPYDLFRDLEPVTIVALGNGYVLLSNLSFPAHSVQELVALAKKPDQRISYGSAGIGNSTQLIMEMFNSAAKIHMVHVPYKGVAPAINAVIGGEVQVMFIPPTSVVQHIKAGKVRALAFTGRSRWALLPDVPTIAESGLPAFHKDSGFNALFAPARTPAAVIAKLQTEIHKALQAPKVKEVFVNGAYDVLGNSPAEAKQYLSEQVKAYSDIVRAIGIEPN